MQIDIVDALRTPFLETVTCAPTRPQCLMYGEGGDLPRLKAGPIWLCLVCLTYICDG